MTFIQFAVPRKDDFTIRGLNATFREESDGSRTLKGSGLYSFNNNSGYYSRTNNAVFYPYIEIKNLQGQVIHTLTSPSQKTARSGASSLQVWNFSYTENFPYSVLKENSLSVNARFLSGKGSRKPRHPDGTECNKNCSHLDSDFSKLLSSDIKNSGLINLVNVQEEKRMKEIEDKRLSDLENFVDSDVTETKPIEKTKPIEEIKPIEAVSPILLILGVGLVSYYLLKENKK